MTHRCPPVVRPLSRVVPRCPRCPGVPGRVVFRPDGVLGVKPLARRGKEEEREKWHSFIPYRPPDNGDNGGQRRDNGGTTVGQRADRPPKPPPGGWLSSEQRTASTTRKINNVSPIGRTS